MLECQKFMFIHAIVYMVYDVHSLLCCIGCPDKPPLVEPNSDKLDLELFYQDLPKYYPYLSPTSRQHWELFQSENPEAVQAKTDIRWEMPNLVSAAILSSEPQIEPMDEISSETLGLLHIETAVPKLVCVNLLYVMRDKQCVLCIKFLYVQGFAL